MKPRNTERLYYTAWFTFALFLLLNPAAHAEEAEEPISVRSLVELGEYSDKYKDGVEMYLAGAAQADLVHRFRSTVFSIAAAEDYDPADWTPSLPEITWAFLAECHIKDGRALFVLAQLEVIIDGESADHVPGAWVVDLNNEKCGVVNSLGENK